MAPAAPKSSRTSASSRSASSSRSRQAAPAPTALSGKLYVAAGILTAMGLICGTAIGNGLADRALKALKLADAPPVDMTKWEAGKVEEISITLVTADYTKLACAYEREIGGAHCEYKTDTEKWPLAPSAPVDDNRKNVIQPYSAVPDNAFILVAGLWAQPEVAMRLHAEPPENTPTRNLARFIARCRVRPVERVSGVNIRWNVGDKWAPGSLRAGDQQVAPWVAIAESCSVEEE
jgi:hypothetical protein